MNAIGIDLETTICSVTIGEGGAGGTIALHAVGDGRSALIPVSAGDDGSWGSAALLSPSQRRSSFPPASSGLWNDRESLRQFLHNLYDRVYRYIGRLHPAPDTGYLGCFTTPRSQDLGVANTLLREAGFRSLEPVPPSTALLASWLGSTRDPSQECVLGVLAGDTSVSLWSYDLAKSGPRLQANISPVGSVDAAGEAYWRKSILTELAARLPEAAPPQWDWLLHEACWRFAQGMSPGNPAPFQWNDFLHERLAWPLRVSSNDLREWPGVEYIRTRVRALSPRPSLILLGGPGARWRFLKSELDRVAPVWTSESAGEELSRGAALWPSLRSIVDITERQPSPERPAATTGSPGASNAAAAPSPRPSAPPPLLPPWKRREFMGGEDE